MKVHIGKYKKWIGPYQIVDGLFFWLDQWPEKKIRERWDYKLHQRMSEWLASTWVANFCQWVHEVCGDRKIKIHIDHYDAWNACDTMALIILPLLKELKRQKNSHGWISPDDAPKKFRPTAKQIEKAKEHGGWDEKNHLRYDWFLDEIIWTFEQLTNEDSDSQFWKSHGEIDWEVKPEDEGKETKPLRWKKKAVVDWKGLKAHHARIQNGLNLFGKYFQTLWD